ncbi:MAG: AhpC/TSA family protein [Alphaproteobacteria bacterium]|nr:AhpC/TSA family protein [Alphaproteobacteria bacterium]
MGLNDELRKLAESRWGEGRMRQIYDALAAHLERTEAAKHALKVGDTLPEFVLPNAEGRLVSSRELLAQGPLVVAFFRGDWCPFCNLTLAALEDALPRIETTNARLVAMTPDANGLALRAKHRNSVHYDVLCDIDNGVAMQFGVVYRVPDEYRKFLEDYKCDLGTRHGNDMWTLPMPSAFVIDRQGVIRYAFVNGDILVRAEPDEIIAELKKL